MLQISNSAAAEESSETTPSKSRSTVGAFRVVGSSEVAAWRSTAVGLRVGVGVNARGELGGDPAGARRVARPLPLHVAPVEEEPGRGVLFVVSGPEDFAEPAETVTPDHGRTSGSRIEIAVP